MSGAPIRIEATAVETREVDGEIVIYDLRARTYLGGNAAATALWPLLAEGTSLPDLAAALEREFEIGPERAAADAGAFVESLRRRGLLAREAAR